MDRYLKLWRLAASTAAFALTAAAAPVTVPTGTELFVRLKTKVASNVSKAKDPVEAEVIAPVVIAGEFVIPAGAPVRGTVQEAKASTKPDERAVLQIAFTEIEVAGKKATLAAKVTGIDNARETVTDTGEIQGILASESISSRIDQGIGKVADRFAGFAEVLGVAKGAILKTTESEIAYEPGVEIDLALTAPLTLETAGGAGPAAKLAEITDDSLIELAATQPFQTTAQKPPKPSDMTNIMLVGTQEQVEAAFKAAGWYTAAALSTQSKLETFRAIAEQRGYNEAPVSILLLEGNPPDMVFQKQNNTFAKRHHLRVWKRPVTWQGKPVWVVAATHDTGIEFSQQNRTFIHKIDTQIDRERAKVVNDLVYTGKVKALALVDRPNVPKKSQNATGDALETDGHIAVLLFE